MRPSEWPWPWGPFRRRLERLWSGPPGEDASTRDPWDERFSQLAVAVAAGDAVDWEAECRAATPVQVGLIEELRELEQSLMTPACRAAGNARRWGPFHLRERLGTGSVGSVYRAWDPHLRQDVAVKLLEPGPSDREALLVEARSLARVRTHPNIVTVYGAAVEDGAAGFWMELIEGRTLADLLGDWGRFGAAEAAAVGAALCRALAAIHAAGLVHQDVKAQNVMRESGGRVVLMDMGASVITSAASPRWGTPLYMAPELFDRRPATPQSDIYSLGVLLFHLVTGQFPHGDDGMRTFRAGNGVERPGTHRGPGTLLGDLRPDLPESFVAAVETALEPDPALRVATAAAFGRELRAVGA